MMRRSIRAEDGLTLVELLVSTTITGVILTVITSSIYVGIRSTTDAGRGLDQSNAEQIIANRFTADVQGACNPALSVPTCGRNPNPSVVSGSACGTTALFAMDSVSSASAAAADTTVAYVLQGTSLMRLSCAYGTTTVTSSVTLAKNVSGNPVVSYPVSGACTGQFQLALTLTGSTRGNGTPNYDITLCGRRRA